MRRFEKLRRGRENKRDKEVERKAKAVAERQVKFADRLTIFDTHWKIV